MSRTNIPSTRTSTSATRSNTTATRQSTAATPSLYASSQYPQQHSAPTPTAMGSISGNRSYYSGTSERSGVHMGGVGGANMHQQQQQQPLQRGSGATTTPSAATTHSQSVYAGATRGAAHTHAHTHTSASAAHTHTHLHGAARQNSAGNRLYNTALGGTYSAGAGHLNYGSNFNSSSHGQVNNYGSNVTTSHGQVNYSSVYGGGSGEGGTRNLAGVLQSGGRAVHASVTSQYRDSHAGLA